MKPCAIPFWSIKSSVLFFLLASLPAMAQVVPDATLSVNSLVTRQGNTWVIERGTTKGGNLFHSFEQFSIPTGSTVLFNNAPNILNIFSRVTGSSISNIDGLIRANGAASLFLINPNGIIFGSNSQLNIGGSFVASTASSLKFADGTQFSAAAPQNTPLLTISVPIGLQFGSNSGGIQVQGTGQGLTAPNSLTSSIIRNSSLTGFSVQPGKTLALVGGDVTLEGGTLTAEGGRINLGSVGSGLVSLSSTAQGLTLGYEGVSSFKDIHLSQQALVDTSGDSGGSIAVQGKFISLNDGSAILIQNQGSQPSSSISVNASESLLLNGTSPDGRFPSILRTEAVGSGNGGNIAVSTKQLVIQEGASIGSRTYSVAKGGNLNVNASKSVQLLKFSPFNPFLTSNISASTLASGSAGDITVSTGRLVARDGGTVISLTRGTGSGGDVIVNAANSVELINSTELINSGANYGPSDLAATAFNAGNAGSLTINTSRLVVGTDANVNSATVGSGSAGSVTIKADNVEVSGAVGSSAITADETTQQLFAAPPLVSGSPGDVIINTRRLSVTDGGLISVVNEGPSNAGMLRINAGSISLGNKSAFTASTASGEGGNIFLNAQNLQLRHGSTITATAGNHGNGGNINIDTGTLAALENGDITANAFEGRGGNVKINTKGLFVSRDSEITASSQRGVNGTVQINAPEVDFTRAAVYFPSALNTPNIALICAGRSGGAATGELVNAGRGGIPRSPEDPLNSSAGWYDHSIPAQETEDSEAIAQSTKIKPVQKFLEAQGWKSNGDGTVRFTTEPDEVVSYGSLSEPPCHARALSTKN